MAFHTLDQLRTLQPGLNSELGLLSDADNSFGDTNARNSYLQAAINKLWPAVGKLTRETFTSVANQKDYTLTTLYDVERLEIIDPATGYPTDSIRSFMAYLDEVADPPTIRLQVPTMVAGMTVRAIGYVPYLVPSTGATTCDLPPRIEHVVRAGARVEAYRAKVNSFANFERMQNENRANALSAADILELLRQAQREFQQGVNDNARNLTAPKRARLQTG